MHLDPVQQSCHSSIFSSDWISGRRASQGSVQWKQGFSDVHESPIYIGLCPENTDMFVHDKFDKFQLANIVNKIIRGDGRSNVSDCFGLQFVLIALIGLYFPDCPDWFRLP